MQACDVYRYLCMTLRENCASVKYSDDGRRVDVSGAWGDAPSFDDLRALRRCNSAVRSWLACRLQRRRGRRKPGAESGRGARPGAGDRCGVGEVSRGRMVRDRRTDGGGRRRRRPGVP